MISETAKSCRLRPQFLVGVVLLLLNGSLTSLRLAASEIEDTAKRIGAVSGFPIASPDSWIYDPGLVGWTAGVEYDSATRAAEVLAAESMKSGELRESSKLLRRILIDNHNLNASMHEFRMHVARSRKHIIASSILSGVAGVLLSEPRYAYEGTIQSPIEVITPEEHERIQGVISVTMSHLDENARAFKVLDGLESSAELKVAGARLILQRELATIWEDGLYPILRGSVSSTESTIVSIGSSARAGQLVKMRVFDERLKRVVDRQAHKPLDQGRGSFLVTPRERLTNFTMRVVWTGENGAIGKWFGYFRQVSPTAPFVVPACGDFSTLRAPVLLPALVPENERLGPSPSHCEISVHSDQGSQSFSLDIPANGTVDDGTGVKQLREIVESGAAFLKTLPGDAQFRNIPRTKPGYFPMVASVEANSFRYPDPVGARAKLLRELSNTKWKGTIPNQTRPGFVTVKGRQIEVRIPKIDETTKEFNVMFALTDATGAAQTSNRAVIHKEFSRECVIAIAGQASHEALEQQSRVDNSTKEIKTKGRPVATTPSDLLTSMKRAPDKPWMPVEGRYRGTVIGLSSSGNPYLYLYGDHGGSSCKLERLPDSGNEYWENAANKTPKLSEADKTHLAKLKGRRLQWHQASVKQEKEQEEKLRKEKRGSKRPVSSNTNLTYDAKQLKDIEKWSELDFGVALIAAYADATDRANQLQLTARGTKDLHRAALEAPLVRYTPKQNGDAEPVVVRDKPDFAVILSCKQVLVDGHTEKGVHASQVVKDIHSALDKLSDEGLLAIKLAYMTRLKKG